jgi:hypothetical protein
MEQYDVRRTCTCTTPSIIVPVVAMLPVLQYCTTREFSVLFMSQSEINVPRCSLLFFAFIDSMSYIHIYGHEV